jgi:hypothetical protein
MAGQIPSFITGANAKIKINNVTMAYAQDVSYSVDVATIPVETIGRYEVVTNEPISYYVSGTLSVIRYTKAASTVSGKNTPTNGKDNGNSINNWMDSAASTAGNMGHHFDPKNLVSSKTFDLEIFSKLPSDTATTETDGKTVTATESIVKIRDCRLTRKSGAVTKRGLIVDQFAFSAVLMNHDDDTAVGTSGDDDLK